jgi:hypothetical protein
MGIVACNASKLIILLKALARAQIGDLVGYMIFFLMLVQAHAKMLV